MRSSVIYFIDGPWEGRTREDPTVVPSEVIPVYAEADSGVVCADEQVIKKLGRYRKVPNVYNLPLYNYKWEPENN